MVFRPERLRSRHFESGSVFAVLEAILSARREQHAARREQHAARGMM